MPTKKCSVVALAAAIVASMGYSARANSIPTLSIDTGIAAWKYDSTTAPHETDLGSGAAVVPTYNGAWLPAATVNSEAFSNSYEAAPAAQWVGVRSDGNNVGYYGDFTFSLTVNFSDFVPPVTGSPPQGFVISGAISADNEITDLYLVDDNSTPYILSLGLLYDGAPGNSPAYGFRRVFGAFDLKLLDNPFKLVAVIHNDYPASAGIDPVSTHNPNESPEDPANPLGFIVAGSITATTPVSTIPVPLPEAAGVGFSMLGGFGGLAALRKRIRSKPRIA